jgi:hypothetical protein
MPRLNVPFTSISLPAALLGLLLSGPELGAQSGATPPVPDAGSPSSQGGQSTRERIEEERDRVREAEEDEEIRRARMNRPPQADVVDRTRPMNFGFRVVLHQDPKRIAPGETGQVVLQVILPPQQKGAQPAGSIKWHQKPAPDEPFSYGVPSFSPPKEGRANYGDSFVVTVPVGVKAGIEYDKYQISGVLKLRGNFSTPGVGSPGAVDGSGEAGSMPPPPPMIQRNEAEIAFTGALTIGPPVPRPGGVGSSPGSRQQPGGRNTPLSMQPEGSPFGEAGVHTAGEGQARPGLGQGDVVSGEPTIGGSSDPLQSAGASSSSGGDLNLILKILGVLAAIVLLLLIVRGKGR